MPAECKLHYQSDFSVSVITRVTSAEDMYDGGIRERKMIVVKTVIFSHECFKTVKAMFLR